MRLFKKRYDVFISYTRENLEFAERLARELGKFQYSTWLDKHSGLSPGEPLARELQKTIKQSCIFLVVIPRSSEYSWARWEFDQTKNQKIIPVVPPKHGNLQEWPELDGLARVDFRADSFDECVRSIYREIDQECGGFSIKQIGASILVAILAALISSVLWAFILQRSEITRIEQVQQRVQHLENRIKDRDFRRVVDSGAAEILFLAGRQVLARDEFDAANRRIAKRSFYDENGRRIAIDRFEWAEAGPVRKTRTHFDARGNAFLRESFSSTGKLEKKEHDQDRNEIFIEREADFVSPFPAVVVFPAAYR